MGASARFFKLSEAFGVPSGRWRISEIAWIVQVRGKIGPA